MPSSYTTNTGIEKIATGEQSGTWGTTTNGNFDIIDRVVNGVGTITLSGTTHTLTTSDGSLSDGQYKLLVLSGTPSGTNTITISPNDAQKIYFVQNNSGQSAVFTQGSGGNVTIANGDSKIIYANGGGAGAAVADLTDNFAMGSVKITGGSITGIVDLAVADGGTGASSAAAARTNLDAQQQFPTLDDIGGLTPTDTHGIVGNGSNYISTSASNTALLMPSGTTAQRPTPSNGMLRYNEDDNAFEGYADGAWGAIGGGGTEAGGAIVVNTTTASESYTFPSGTNGFSVGPITVSSGVTVTVASGQRWVVI